MDLRGTLHGRHHTAQQADGLMAKSFSDLDMRLGGSPPNGSLSTILVASDDFESRLHSHHDACNSTANGSADSLLDLHRHHQTGGSDSDSNSSSSSSSISPASSDPGRSWDDTYRFRKSFRGLQALDTLDIMRESSRVFRRQSDLLTTLTAAFVVPVSVILLTHVLVTRPAIRWLEGRLEIILFEESVAEAIETRYSNFLYLKMAEFLISSLLFVPLAISLAALSKAGIIYTVASTYAGVKVSFVDIIHRVVPRVWFPLTVTFASSCSVFLALGLVILLCLSIFNGVFSTLRPSSSVTLFFFGIMGLVFCGVFVYLKVVANVASVICVLEDRAGYKALARSASILRGRVQVGIMSFLVTLLVGGFLTLLFEFRVVDKNAYTEYNSSGAWEGPLLVLMHSFVYMFDEIMITVLYFTCPRSSSAYDPLDSSRVPEGVGSVALASL